ncbi:G-protein coupled receptor 35-like [Ambystoma mexicanum]|uniref:G-protein coupled receptor 35-like n=1 Tax=Ambystoma mexicanum TaxID=8296 RepID=UPI0037E718F7
MPCNSTSGGNPLEGTLQLLKLTAYVPVFALGLIFNALALWVFCCKLKQWTESRVYMINLIISDCSLLFTFPFRLYSYSSRWDLGNGLCVGLMSVYFVNTYMSIFTITIIAVHRYIAIKHPLKAKWWSSPPKATIVCGLLWTIFISLCLFETLTSKDFEHRLCFQKTTTHPFKTALMFVCIGFVLPLLILSFCSFQIIRTLKGKDNASLQDEQAVKKAVHIITANLIVFIICFLPVHVGYLARFIAESTDASCYVRQHIHMFVHVATYMANCNCFLDAICYYFVAKEFREAYALLQNILWLQNCSDNP